VVGRLLFVAFGSDVFAFRILHDVWITRYEALLTNAATRLNGFCEDYYRQVPPKVPHFLRTLFRRKLVLWYVRTLLFAPHLD
jgi:hypothetical protein